MEARPTSRAAVPSLESTARLAHEFASSLARPDIAGAHGQIIAALAGGASPGRLYVEVVRPALTGLQGESAGPPTRLAAGIAESVIADLVERLPLAARRGTGRVALLTCRRQGIEAVDGAIALEFLDADGWTVERYDRAETASDMAGLAREGAIELAVAVIAGPADALRLAPSCTALRRLADPPVILLCDFSPSPTSVSASSALGADAVVGDPEALIREAGIRSPAAGARRWGVRLSRAGRTLTFAPTGRLDRRSVARLADMATSRSGTYDSLVLDLRDLAVLEPAAMAELPAFGERISLGSGQVSVVPPLVAA